ncbi:hypothetical protein FTO74_12635 [Granulicella sp. WH15]|uniref:hypothetical protein n=1 Tax=Granulicella sp. WH15 TaxID=2602070 RepID=UPI001366B1DD|nr:hypothetical protein [Granulicella sp. WH15]QHN04122.1 hypothetical protein FTO74_12635 [Granulicella sp. WH15]
MRDNAMGSSMRIGPSLLPVAEQARTRRDRRHLASPASHHAERHVAGRVAIDVHEIRLHGVAAGIRETELRREIARSLQSALAAHGGHIPSGLPVPILRAGASARELAAAMTAAILNDAARREEAPR